MNRMERRSRQAEDQTLIDALAKLQEKSYPLEKADYSRLNIIQDELKRRGVTAETAEPAEATPKKKVAKPAAVEPPPVLRLTGRLAWLYQFAVISDLAIFTSRSCYMRAGQHRDSARHDVLRDRPGCGIGGRG
ncbi:hypothetical protein BH20ACI2_BH20ACI2_20930 [soil metagenome]